MLSAVGCFGREFDSPRLHHFISALPLPVQNLSSRKYVWPDGYCIEQMQSSSAGIEPLRLLSFSIASANWRRCQALKVLIGAVGPNSRILGRDDLWREPRAQHDYCGESRSSSVTLSRPVNLPSRNLKHEHDRKRTSTQNYGNYRIHSNIAVGR
jgi:hypothetical protein